jgi:Ni,Fe-hydrogenase III small subunit/Pyruvate/2-oxoacid:ferredoxin oxidoreductase delta subunit
MISTVVTRIAQGHRTMRYPDHGAPPPEMPGRFRGRPQFDAAKCPEGCRQCADACPTQAITISAGKISLDMGRCLFCIDCADACPEQAISYSRDYRLAVSQASALVVAPDEELKLAAVLDDKLRKMFGRSLHLRQVCAGGCNGCESDVNVLTTIGWDLSRFGISFVASPRHADGLLITGPVTQNMRQALKDAYDAVPEPKIVIAVGACALSGGPYIDHTEVNNGVENTVPIDLFIPGCPPHPMTILDGLLRLLGRIAK